MMRFFPFLASSALVTVLAPAMVVQAQSLESLFRQGEAAQVARDYTRAESIWREILDSQYDIPIGDNVPIDPSNISYPDVYDNLGIALASQGRYEEAANAHREAIHLDSDFPGSHYLLGLALADQDNLVAAEQAYRQAIRLNSDFIDAYLSLGGLLFRQERYQEAEEVYGTATTRSSQNADAYTGLGDALYLQERYAAAAAAFRDALRIAPDFAYAHWSLGKALDQQGRYQEAAEALQTSIRLNPRNDLGHRELGYVLLAQENYPAAEEAFRDALRINSNDFFSYSGLGDVLFQQERYDEAEAAYRDAIEIDSSYDFAYWDLGNSLFRQGRDKEAALEYRKALRLNAENVDVHNNLGYMLFLQGRNEEAEAAFREAIRLDPTYTLAYDNLGELLIAQERYKEAENVFKQSVRLNPGALNRLYLGLLLAKRENFVEAEKLLEEVANLPAPNSALGHFGLGYIYQEQERIEEAIREFETALTIIPEIKGFQDALAEAKLLRAAPIAPSRGELPPQDDRLFALKRSIVIVRTSTLTGQEYGTGWVIKREGNRIWVLTNCHVIDLNLLGGIELLGSAQSNQRCQPSNNIEVTFFSDSSPEQTAVAEVMQTTSSQDEPDLALLIVSNAPEDIQPLTLSNGVRIAQLSNLLIIGHPRRLQPWTADVGTLSNRSAQELQLSDVSLGPGTSGSPVFDEQNNQVVGIVFQTIDTQASGRAAGFGLAYPVEFIRPILQRWGML